MNNNAEEDAQIDADDISYHIAQIILTNRDCLHSNTVLGQQLRYLKFDVVEIDNLLVH